jgi:hypothetical protein
MDMMQTHQLHHQQQMQMQPQADLNDPTKLLQNKYNQQVVIANGLPANQIPQTATPPLPPPPPPQQQQQQQQQVYQVAPPGIISNMNTQMINQQPLPQQQQVIGHPMIYQNDMQQAQILPPPPAAQSQLLPPQHQQPVYQQQQQHQVMQTQMIPQAISNQNPHVTASPNPQQLELQQAQKPNQISSMDTS